MKHAYLSKVSIDDALSQHAITQKEAKKLQKKIESQVSIFKSLHK